MYHHLELAMACERIAGQIRHAEQRRAVSAARPPRRLLAWAR